MKRLILTISLVAALVIMVAAEVPALTLQVYQNSCYSSGNGGEFEVVSTYLSAGAYAEVAIYNGGFATFCVEESEYFSPGAIYNYQINDRAIAGGVGPTGDVISVGTAWLYSQFALGILAGYDYTPGAGRVASAGALQSTIWWLEGEGGLPVGTNAFRDLVYAHFGSDWSNAKFDNAPGGYGVWVLNLTVPGSGELAQDQLYFVPEPFTLLGLGICLVGVAGIRRKFKKFVI